MKVFDPSKHTPRTIDDEGTRRFEAFLDRNFTNWRDREFMRAKNKGHVSRSWAVDIDDVERVALYRGEYVEIYDQCFSKDDEGEIQVEYPKGFICDIDGDLTPVAVWGKRQPERRWDNSLLPHYRTGIEQLYQSSVSQGFQQPVIVGFELVHEYACSMAIEQFGKDTVESYIQSARTDEPAVLFAALSQEQARQRLPLMQGFKRLDDLQTQGMFAVVFVRDDKSEWISVPIPGDSLPDT